MALESRQAASCALPDAEDAATDASPRGSTRARRHVLIPSELVSVELTSSGAAGRPLQADMINVSQGGCCLVLAQRLSLAPGAQGVVHRLPEHSGSEERRPFVVRWVQNLGEMMEIGVQYSEP